MPHTLIRRSTIALCQTTTTTPSNQTGNNTPGQVFNGDTSANGGTTGTFNGASPTRNDGTNTGTYKGHDRIGYQKALRACDDMKADQQSACRDRVAVQYRQSDKSNGTNTAMEKTPRLSEQCDQLYGTKRSDCMKSLSGGGNLSVVIELRSPRCARRY